jgi:hypothetical protein
MTTNEIIQILKEHRTLSTVSLQRAKDCSEFWDDFCESVYRTLPIMKDGIEDYAMLSMLKDFRNIDTLEVVNKKGRILKRFANWIKSEHGVKLSDSMLGIIGDVLQRHLSDAEHTYFYDFTDSIDWNDGQFGKDESCWWGGYKESKDVYTSNGGWGMRFYQDANQDDDNGIGRTWIYPHNGMLLGFNSYGVSRPQTSKVLKAIFAEHGIKLHYKQVSIENSQDSEIPYINGDSGFVLYPDTMDGDNVPTSYDLDMETDHNKTRCEHCNCTLDTEYGDYTIVSDSYYCESCTNRLFSYCDGCEEYCDKDDVHLTNDDRYLCKYCLKREGYVECYECNTYVEEYITDSDGDEFCESCADKHLTHCDECDVYVYGDAHECPSKQDFSGLVESVESLHAQLSINGNVTENHDNVKVYRLQNVTGITLYNYRDVTDELNSAWSISHDISGFAVKSDIDSFSKAKEIFLALAPLCDWNQDAKMLSDNHELMSTIFSTIKTILEG